MSCALRSGEAAKRPRLTVRIPGFAREVADELVFMDGGVIVESGPPRELLANPKHERTQAFLSKVM